MKENKKFKRLYRRKVRKTTEEVKQEYTGEKVTLPPLMLWLLGVGGGKRLVVLGKCFYDTFNKICSKENSTILRIDMVMESSISE